MAMRFREYAYPYGDSLWMDPGAQVIVDHMLLVADDILTRCAANYNLNYYLN